LRVPTRVALPFLRDWRLARYLTQDEFATLAGVAKSTIYKLEAGRNSANLGTVGRLAKALGVERSQLVREQPPEVHPPSEAQGAN
jgi:transcriptional regulator with XRE-family HTH domain